MNFKIPVLVVAIILSMAGAILSGVLLSKHIPNATAPEWFNSLCDSAVNARFDCSSVLNSRWAYFPPKNEDGTPTPYSRPAALWGLWYFTFMAVWYLFIGFPDYTERKWHWVALVCNAAGLAGAAYFVYVMMTKMDSKCVWCLITHGINALLMICTVVLWPRRPLSRATLVEQYSEPLPDGRGSDQKTVTASGHPGLRLVVATVAMAAVMMFSEILVANAYALNSQLVEYKQYHESLKKDIGLLKATYESQKQHEIPIRPDDPIRGEGANLIELVVFSDFQCPKCRTFAKNLDEELNKLFEGKLKIVFKHFPACKDCNPMVAKTIRGHEEACIAALAAEAARMQGGSAAFWKAHDKLFAEQKAIKSIDWNAFAKELGLDPVRFDADRNSESAKKRIVEDVELAKSIGVVGTPSAFLSGRYVPPLVRESGMFWREMKSDYDKSVAKRNASKTAPEADTEPTENSQ